MSGLRMSQGGLDDLIRFKANAAKGAGADGLDIRLMYESGMDGQDIMRLRRFTANEQLLIIIRCPKPNAAAFHGTLDPKNVNTKAKTNATGTVRDANGHLMVSDYDMMSVWRYTGSGYQKIFVSALDPPGAPRGAWAPEAVRIVRAMNALLVSKIQHGCQDDFVNVEKNPGLKMADHFLAFDVGTPVYLPTPIYCENFYRAHGLPWPYDSSGRHTGQGGP
jgi:hypothetical protein